MNVCVEPNCRDKPLARGLCGRHYHRRLRRGTLPAVPDRVRKCPRCGKPEGEVEFGLRPTGKSYAYCRLCHSKNSRESFVRHHPDVAPRQPGMSYDEYLAHRRRKRWERQYGVPASEYDRMLTQQNGVCAVCYRDPDGKHKKLHMDHDHETGQIRSLLCTRCNWVLGAAQDNADLLRRLIEYLARHGQPDGQPEPVASKDDEVTQD